MVQLLTQLVRKAEDTSQQLASRLRSTGGKPEEAAKGSNSPSSPIGDLILAARNSFQGIVEDAADQAEPGSSSDDSSHDVRTGGDVGAEATTAAALPSRHGAAGGLQLLPFRLGKPVAAGSLTLGTAFESVQSAGPGCCRCTLRWPLVHARSPSSWKLDFWVLSGHSVVQMQQSFKAPLCLHWASGMLQHCSRHHLARGSRHASYDSIASMSPLFGFAYAAGA